jgi:hypothetical protein
MSKKQKSVEDSHFLKNPNSSRHIDLGRGADAADIADRKYAWGEAPGTGKGAERYFRDQSESFEQIKAAAGEKGKDFRNGADFKKLYDPAHIENNNRVQPEPPKTSD